MDAFELNEIDTGENGISGTVVTGIIKAESGLPPSWGFLRSKRVRRLTIDVGKATEIGTERIVVRRTVGQEANPGIVLMMS